MTQVYHFKSVYQAYHVLKCILRDINKSKISFITLNPELNSSFALGEAFLTGLRSG